MNQEVGIQDYLTVMNNSITKALLFIVALSTSLIVPSVIAEDIALSCKKNKFKETELKDEDFSNIKIGWLADMNANYKFEI